MFDFFKKKDGSNVVPFPVDYVKPPEPPAPPPATVFYRLGVTDKNRLAFNMGMTEITMNKAGVQSLIEQLQVFHDQLTDGDEEE